VTRLVVDASVWVSALDSSDEFSLESRRFLDAAVKRGVRLELPAHALVEIACALARRLGDARSARDLAARLVRAPGVHLHALTPELLERAGFLGTELMLRSGDALYLALSRQIEAPLVAWDAELVERAGAVNPGRWMAAATS